MLPIIKFDKFIFDPDDGYSLPSITTSIISNRTSSYQYMGSTQTVNLAGYIKNTKEGCCQDLLEKALVLKSGIITSTPKAFIFSLDNRVVMGGSGYVTDLSFDTSEHNAVDILPYNITLEFASSVTGRTPINDKNKIYNVSNVEDNITINVSDKYYESNNKFFPLYDITHTISAKGNYASNSGAVVEAASWINDRKRLFPASSIIPTSQFPLFNHVRDLDVNELDGSIAITDRFVSKPIEPEKPWAESYSIDTSINSDTEGITTQISLKGTILGLLPVQSLAGIDTPFDLEVVKSGQKTLQPFNSLATNGIRYDGAVSGHKAIVEDGAVLAYRAINYYKSLVEHIAKTGISYTGVVLPLNTGSPIRFVETFDPFNGQITYDIAYNNARKPCISGALPNSESINVTDSAPMQRTSTIPVLGRRLGPVVYDFIASSGLGNRSITYEATFPTGDCKTNIQQRILTDINNLMEFYKPKSPYSGYVVGNEQTVNINTGRITRTKTWSYTKD